jgi:hypothetical protein
LMKIISLKFYSFLNLWAISSDIYRILISLKVVLEEFKLFCSNMARTLNSPLNKNA